ncbi:putative ATP-dependent DNA helicase PIF1 [Hypsibius exemplaris]|nr:putative ATP-dependent DNA helicase PIF1 [Hypsibius exemplaris]
MRRDNSTFFVDQTAAKRKWVRRANPARYAVGRFRYFAPHGDNVESYCLIKLLKAKPARQSTVEGWIAEFGSYLSACVHLGLVEKGAEALHFLKECAMEGFDDLRLREMVERFKKQGWLEDPDIDGLLKTLAPAHQAIRKAREDVIAQAATYAAEMQKEVESIPLEDFLTNMTVSQRSAFTYATDKWEAGEPVRLLITGGAGVGKSYLLKALVAWLRDRHITFAKCATTGIAAHLIGGRTVHNFLGMDFEFNSRIQHGTFQAKALSDTQVVFVDEVSMMPREALTMLDETLPKFNNQNNGAPFTGKSIVLLEDPAQLQVVGKHIWRKDQFSIFQVVVLREVKRQSDTPFIELLNRMRLGNLTDADTQILATRFITREKLIELDMTRGAVLFPFRKEKNAYNVDLLGQLHLSHYRAVDMEANGDVVTSALSREYFALMEKRRRIPAACLSLRVGTKLMLLRNLPNGQSNFGWVNGAMCIVEELTDDSIIVYLQSHPKQRLPFKRLQHDLPTTIFLSVGKKEQYFLLPQLKQFLVWMDVHDIGKGWDERRRWAVLPFVPYPKPGLKNIGLQNARLAKSTGTACFIVPPEINPEDEEDFVDEFIPELLILEPCNVTEDGDLLAVLAAIHLLPLPSSSDARSSVIKDAEYLSTVSEVLRGCADVLDSIRRKVQESAAYFNITTQKQQIDRAALEGMVLWMQKCHLPLTTLGDGHCLLRALSWTLFGHQDGHLRLRLLSISVITQHDSYFFTYRRLLSMKEDFSLPEISTTPPTVLLPSKTDGEMLTTSSLLHSPRSGKSLCTDLSTEKILAFMTSLTSSRQFAHYVGILLRHRSPRESPEFAVTRRYDISVGSRLDWGYVSSDDDDNGFPRASHKRTVSLHRIPIKDPPKQTSTHKPTPFHNSVSEGDRTLLFDISYEEESRKLVDFPGEQLELATTDLVSQDAARDESDIELSNSVGRRHQIIVNHDDWDEKYKKKELFQPSRNRAEQSVLVIEPYIELPSACYELEEPTLSADFKLSDITAGLENAPLPGYDAD